MNIVNDQGLGPIWKGERVIAKLAYFWTCDFGTELCGKWYLMMRH